LRDLTRGNETSHIIAFTLPMLIGNVLQQANQVVDGIIVGKVLGKDALAAVGASFPIMFLIISLSLGVTIGSTVLVAQYFGAKDMPRVKRAIDTAYLFQFASSAVVTALGLLAGRPLLVLLKTPQEILPQAVVFLHIMMGGSVLLFLYMAIGSVLRGLGDSKAPLYFLVVSTAANIALELLFVLGLHWGIAGSAWGTVLAQGLGLACAMIYLQRSRHAFLHLQPSSMVFDRAIFAQSVRIGLPSGIQQMAVAAGMMALSRIVNGFGTVVIAAYTIMGRLEAFVVMPAMAFSMAISTFTGQNLGANKPDRVRHGFHTTMLLGLGVAVFTSAVVLLFRRPLIGVFTTEEAVILEGMKYLSIVAGFYAVFTAQFIFIGVFRGAGDTLVPLLFTLLALWIVRVPAAWLLSGPFGPTGIWVAIPTAWTTGFVLSLLYYNFGKWRHKVVVKVPLEPAAID
jgi:putative MATE family efflux protein